VRSETRRTAREIIQALELRPLPAEGGYFRRTWCNASASAIFFLITTDEFSAIHRIAQDEVWHFYFGDTVEHVQFDADRSVARRAILGPDVVAGEAPQWVVPAGMWQGARILPGPADSHGFALLGCTVSPPWQAAGFELGRRADLLRRFPAEDVLVRALTR
jgi:predicted cupin superfamily sugar epimerase